LLPSSVAPSFPLLSDEEDSSNGLTDVQMLSEGEKDEGGRKAGTGS
jgi:hypothetical protein